MSKRTEEKQTLENILRLDSLRDKLHGADLQKLDEVLKDMRDSVGETVSKSNAAEMFQVSRQTVDKWISKDLLPAVSSQGGRQRISRSGFERALQEVRSLDSSKPRAAIAEALRSLASDIDAPQKKTAAKKTASKKTAAKKTAAKKTAAKKTTAKKTAAKKTTAKKTASKKTAASSAKTSKVNSGKKQGASPSKK